MKRLLLPTLFILICLCRISAQEGYIVTDSLSRFGINLDLESRKNRAHSVTEIIRESKRSPSTTQTYTPDMILAYGVNGKDFESRLIDINGEQKRVFLEKIVQHGSVTVWCYTGGDKDVFFLQKNNELLFMTEDNNPFKTYLEQEPTARDSYFKEGIDKMRLTRYSMKRTEQAVTTGNKNLFTHFRWGILAGGGIGFLHGIDPSPSPDLHLYSGVFANTPLYANLSIQTELYYIKDGYSASKESDNYFNDLIYNKQSLQLPLMLRYTFLHSPKRHIPYLQIGPTLAFVLSSDVQSRSGSIGTNGNSPAPVYQQEKTPSTTVGSSIRGGYEFRFNDRHAYFIDLGYTWLPDKDKRSLSQLFITLSFNL